MGETLDDKIKALVRELNSPGDSIGWVAAPIGGGYSASSEVKPVDGSAYSRLSETDRAVIDRHIDKQLRNAQQARERGLDNPFISDNDRLVAEILVKTEKNGNQREYIEEFVTNSRASYSDPSVLANLKQLEANQQKQARRDR